MVGVPRWGVALAIALLAAALGLGSVLGLATSTETRYAEMGREMRETGDYVVPRFDGAPRLEKPPLAMWAIAGSIAALGENDVAARVPSLVAGLLTMLVVAAAARRLSFASERVERSRFAFVVLGTMPGFLLQAYVVSTDAWLALFVALAGWALLEAERARGRRSTRDERTPA